MPGDLLNDLHAAEDEIGLLRAALNEVLRGAPLPSVLQLAKGTFCRPSCSWADEGSCQDDDPDCCGCPCQHGAQP